MKQRYAYLALFDAVDCVFYLKASCDATDADEETLIEPRVRLRAHFEFRNHAHVLVGPSRATAAGQRGEKLWRRANQSVVVMKQYRRPVARGQLDARVGPAKPIGSETHPVCAGNHDGRIDSRTLEAPGRHLPA